jgi:hypothetical protein
MPQISLKLKNLIFTAFALLLLAVCTQAQVRITIDHNDNKTANAEYKFRSEFPACA